MRQQYMSPVQPKILFFAAEDWFVCSHWLPLISAAKSAGFDVVVVTRVNKHADKILELGITLVPFEISRRGLNPFRELKTIFQLWEIYRKEQPDIVHHVAMKPMLYGSLIARLSSVPHSVNWVAGMGWLFTSNRLKARMLSSIVRKLLGWLLRKTIVIVENKDDQAILASMGVLFDDIHIVRGAGVDTGLYKLAPEPNGMPLVVLPARMLWDKGVGEFVAAASLIKKRGIQASFVLVGEPDPGNPASVSMSQLLVWQKEGAVEWWGRREDMPHVLAMSHIVCLPSYREGLPKSLLEAASCGRPIVTTDVPGCREIVRDGDNGFLVEVRNASALANALEKLLGDATLRVRMGTRGRERSLAEFSQEQAVSQVLALYCGAIA
jgi:glycosyltransferase involved in cell wall biosynthesis